MRRSASRRAWMRTSASLLTRTGSALSSLAGWLPTSRKERQIVQIMAIRRQRGGQTGPPDGQRHGGGVRLILLEAEAHDGPRDPTPSFNTATSELKALAAAAESVIRESMTEMVAVCDLTGAITMMNRTMAAAVGGASASGSPATAVPVWKHRRLEGRAYSAAELPLARALRGEVVTDEEMTVTWAGSRRRWVVVNAATVFDGDGRTLGAVVMMRDITQQRDAEATLAFQALHDGLTGLPGRRLFVERVQRAMSRGVRHRWSTAVFAVKIDGFEALNAQFGHDAGDQIIKEVGKRLQACVRASDAVSRETGQVARLGGDDFLLLCERTGEMVS